VKINNNCLFIKNIFIYYYFFQEILFYNNTSKQTEKTKKIKKHCLYHKDNLTLLFERLGEIKYWKIKLKKKSI
jgi:hypothetical protein